MLFAMKSSTVLFASVPSLQRVMPAFLQRVLNSSVKFAFAVVFVILAEPNNIAFSSLFAVLKYESK